jgi:3-oxoadipate CoA-transferase beta subunit
MAARLAADIPEGWVVNLGVGIPTLVADHIPPDREVIIHSEQGLLGVGPAPPPGQEDRWLINASKAHVTMRPGGSYSHHADSFAMIRGGHIDLCVLGGFQVAVTGDLANWSTLETDVAPAVGGAMDLVAGAKRIWVLIDHVTKAHESKLVERCSYPLTAPAVVKRVYTNLAVLDVGEGAFEVVEMVPGLTIAELKERTAAPLRLQRSA